jgi:hypothetical protein
MVRCPWWRGGEGGTAARKAGRHTWACAAAGTTAGPVQLLPDQIPASAAAGLRLLTTVLQQLGHPPHQLLAAPPVVDLQCWWAGAAAGDECRLLPREGGRGAPSRLSCGNSCVACLLHSQCVCVCVWTE